MTALQRVCSRFTGRASAAVLAALTIVGSVAMQGQTAATPGQVRKIYVETFSGNRGAGEIRDEVIDRPKHHSDLTVVDCASQADAVLKGNGEIWISGYIAGNNPRAQANGRNPIYNEYLSLTLEGGNAQALWSSMVTRSGSLSAAITSNLAEHGAKLLLTAVAHDAPGRNSYPIATFTWIVLPDPLPAQERSALAQMLHWMLIFGQKQSSALGYAPLPHELANRELESLTHLK